MRVMLIEDNRGDVMLVREALRPHAVELSTHSNGEEALRALNSVSGPDGLPDLILLDLKMPRMSGLEVLEKVKGDVRLRMIPVIVLTSSQAPHDVNRAYALQASACIAKPSGTYDEVMSRILEFFDAATPRQLGQMAIDEEDEGLPPVLRARDASISRTRNQLASNIVASAADAVIGVDIHGRIGLWNDAAARLYGYTAEEALGKGLELVIPDGRLPEMRALLKRMPADQPVHRMRIVRVDEEHGDLRIELTVSPIRDDAGRVIGMSLIARDISEQWRAEERFRLAVEACPSAMVMVDADGLMEMVNAETENLFGYARDKLIGQPVEMLVPERFRARHPGQRRGFHRSPEFRAMGAGRELFGLRADGTEIPVEIGLNPIHTPDGVRVLCAIVDVTERRRADAMFRIAVEAAPSGIAMVAADGTIVLVNAETERMFRYGRGELAGRSIDDLVPTRFRGQHQRYRSKYASTPERRAMGSGRELYGLRSDGSEFPVEIGLNPIETPDGTFVLSTIVDITSRKAAERELHVRRRELARSNEELEQFAYVASHDLQEPLRMVTSYTDLLARHLADVLDEDARRYIGFAQDGAARMRTLIQDLLALSRVRTRGRELTEISLAECADAALANLEQVVNESGARIDLQLESRVLGDPGQLTLVFQNLISNAIKFSNEGVPVVRIREQLEGRFVRVAVSDEGLGIPPQHADRIFLPFERLHTREEFPGTGIGLAICKRVIDRHGGEIGVLSDGESGSTVHFTVQRPD